MLARDHDLRGGSTPIAHQRHPRFGAAPQRRSPRTHVFGNSLDATRQRRRVVRGKRAQPSRSNASDSDPLRALDAHAARKSCRDREDFLGSRFGGLGGDHPAVATDGVALAPVEILVPVAQIGADEVAVVAGRE